MGRGDRRLRPDREGGSVRGAGRPRRRRLAGARGPVRHGWRRLRGLVKPIEFAIDIEARTAKLVIPGLIEATGSPIVDPNSGEEFRARIDLPNGFEYSIAEMGTASSKVTAGIELMLSDSYGQWNVTHMNQDGVIR